MKKNLWKKNKKSLIQYRRCLFFGKSYKVWLIKYVENNMSKQKRLFCPGSLSSQLWNVMVRSLEAKIIGIFFLFHCFVSHIFCFFFLVCGELEVIVLWIMILTVSSLNGPLFQVVFLSFSSSFPKQSKSKTDWNFDQKKGSKQKITI